MDTADLHPVQVRMLVQELPHLLRRLRPDVREGLVSKKQGGVTRSGYRYGIVSADRLVKEAQGHFGQTCPEEWCWMFIQGGDQAMADHRKTVHRDTDGRRPIHVNP